MGFLRRQKQALEQISKERMQAFLREVDEVSRRHGLVLVPVIGKYGANFEIQEMPEEKKAVSEEKEEISEENARQK